MLLIDGEDVGQRDVRSQAACFANVYRSILEDGTHRKKEAVASALRTSNITQHDVIEAIASKTPRLPF
jgi:uncharacterized protein (DUF2336 family)